MNKPAGTKSSEVSGQRLAEKQRFAERWWMIAFGDSGGDTNLFSKVCEAMIRTIDFLLFFL